MKQRVYLTSDNKLVVETDNGRIQNGETETAVKGEFTISADDVNTLRVVLNDEIVASVKEVYRGFWSEKHSFATTKDKLIIELSETHEKEKKSLDDRIALHTQDIEKAHQSWVDAVKKISLWDRIFNWKKQFKH